MKANPAHIVALAIGSLAALAVLHQGCGAPVRRPQGPPLERMSEPQPVPGEDLLTTGGDLGLLREILLESGADPWLFTFLSAELDVLEGHFRRGFERYGEVLLGQPDGLLGALAALRMTQLRDLVSDFYQLVPVLLAQIEGLRVNPLTAQYTNLLWLQAAQSVHSRLGTTPSGPFSGEEQGLPDEWRFAGPFSTLPFLHLERPEPYQSDLVLGESYRPDGRRVTTRNLVGNELEVSVSTPFPGTYVFETWAHLDATSDRIATLETFLPSILSIDDQAVLGRQTTGDYDPVVLMRPIRLEAGWHRVRVALGTQDGTQDFRVRLVSQVLGETGLSFACRPPEGVQMAPSTVGEDLLGGLRRMLPLGVLEAQDPLGAFALLLFSADFHEEELVRRGYEALTAGGHRSPLMAMAMAWFVNHQQTLPPGERLSQRLRYIREVLSGAPSSGAGALTLAGLLALDGRDEEAMRLLTPVVQRLLQEEAMVMGLVELYMNRGWDELAEPELERVLQSAPEACGVIERLVEIYERRDHTPELQTLPQGFQTCEAGLAYQVEHIWIPGQQMETGQQVLRLLSDRYPDDFDYHRQIYDLLMREGRYDEALAEIEQAGEYAWEPEEVVLYQVDWLLMQGRDDEARQRLERALEEEFPGDYTLLQAQTILDDTALLHDLRLDTLEAIQAYRQRGNQLRSNTVYALDYAAYRFFPGGSGLTVTHQIIHIQSREALAQYGEIAIPSRSLLLRARTIKADGTILEPDNIPGKDTVSLPNLEVGDFAEFEYLDLLPASALRGDTVLGSRFYFQLPDSAFSRSELVVEVPQEWSELLIDRRPDSLEPEVTVHDGYRHYRFTVYDSRPPMVEPGAPALDEYLTSVRIAHGIQWGDIRDAYLDRQRAVVRRTPEIDALTGELVRDVPDMAEKVHRIFRFVVDEVEEVGGFLGTDAIWTLRLREGERLPLLLAMLEAVGAEAFMVFLRSWEDDQIDSPIPDGNQFPETAVLVRAAGDEYWLFPSQERAVFNYLPPEIQGTLGLVIAGADEDEVQWIQTPVWPDETNRIQIEMDLALEENGDVRGQVVEHTPIRLAASMRWMLEQVQDQQSLVQQLEQELSRTFSGATVGELTIEGADRDDEPLQFHYRLSARGFARREGDRLVLDTRIFDREIRDLLGAVERRTVPLSVPFPYREELLVRIQLPEGYRFVTVPAPVEIDHPQLSYSWSIPSGGIHESSILMQRSTSIPVGRVSPEDYPDLLELLLQVDHAEALHLVAEP